MNNESLSKYDTIKKYIDEIDNIISNPEIINYKLELIKKIIKNIITNSFYKTICKKNKKDKWIIDFKKIDNDKKYIIQINNKENITYKKKQYILVLFRLIENLLPSFSINDVLFDQYINKKNNNYTILSSGNKYTKPVTCNIYLRMQRRGRSGYVFSIIVSKFKNDDIIKKYEKYLTETYNNNFANEIVNILNENKKTEELIEGYPFFLYSIEFDNKTNENFNISVFLLLQFFMINCDTDYIFSSLNIIVYKEISNGVFYDKNTEYTKINHRNKLIQIAAVKEAEAEKESEKELYKISVYNYEPHGKFGISNVDLDITNFFKLFNEKIRIANKDLDKLITKYDIEHKYPKLVSYVLYKKDVSCEIGSQMLASTEDIGYCTIFSTYWYNVLLNVLSVINAYDNLLLTKHKKYDNKYKLSSVSITYWIKSIDEEITNLRKEDVEYDDNEYNIDFILDIADGMLEEDDEKYGIFGNHTDDWEKNKIIFKNNLKKNIIKLNKNSNELTFRNFLRLYGKIVLDIADGMERDEKEELISNLYKLKNFSYFSIFVNYAYGLFEIIHKNNYITIKQYKLLDEFSKDPNYFKKLKLTN